MISASPFWIEGKTEHIFGEKERNLSIIIQTGGNSVVSTESECSEILYKVAKPVEKSCKRKKKPHHLNSRYT